MPPNIYDNYRPFDVHKWTESPQLIEAVSRIYAELFPRREERKKRVHLLVVLADLYKCHLEDPEKYLAYQRANGAYGNDERYNEVGITSDPLKAVIDALAGSDYVENILGFRDTRPGGSSRLSRMKALPKLIDLIESCSGGDDRSPVPAHEIYRHLDEELIILKSRPNAQGVKKPLDYEDTEETNRMRAELKAYNELLERTFIDLDLRGYLHDVRIDTTNKRVRRIFNDGTFDHGGRFYGGWWQNIKKELRKRITMGETYKPTIEIDYKALHINLLYNRVGINYFGTYGENADPYQVQGMYDSEERDLWRSFYKLVLLVCLNSASKASAIKAISKELADENNIGKYPDIGDRERIRQAIELFETMHEPIRDYFYSGVGIQLQRIDSMIAEKVLNHFVQAGLPILCMHDSFICTTRDSMHLEEVINSAMLDTVNSLGGEWSSCPITPLSRTTDIRVESQQELNPDDPFVTSDLEELMQHVDSNGNYDSRLEYWRRYRGQTIIDYKV